MFSVYRIDATGAHLEQSFPTLDEAREWAWANFFRLNFTYKGEYFEVREEG